MEEPKTKKQAREVCPSRAQRSVRKGMVFCGICCKWMFPEDLCHYGREWAGSKDRASGFESCMDNVTE